MGETLIHSQPWVAELIEAAGGEFVGNPGKQTDTEAVRQADPHIVVAAWCGAGNRVPLEKIAARPAWQSLTAVREGRVYCINDEYLNTPGPALLAGLHALDAAIHDREAPGLRRIAAVTSSR